MKKKIDTLLRPWNKSPPLFTIALVRIFVGVFILWAYLSQFHVLQILTDSNGLKIYIYETMNWYQHYVLYIYWILIVSTIFFIIGYKTILFGVIVLICHLIFLEANLHLYGWTHTFPFLFVPLLFSYPHYRVSIDARLNHKKRNKPASYGYILLKIHISLLYLSTALYRVGYELWDQGIIVYYLLNIDQYTRFETLTSLDIIKKISPITTYSVLIVEFFSPILMWFRKTSIIGLCALIIFHLGLDVFSIIEWWHRMLICFLLIFIPDTWAMKIFEKSNIIIQQIFRKFIVRN